MKRAQDSEGFSSGRMRGVSRLIGMCGGALLAVVSVALTGCLSIPQPPKNLASRHLHSPRTYVGAPQAKAGPAPADWVQRFHSKALSRLVHEALANNPDLHAAAARWQQAEAQIIFARANLLPQINASAGAGRTDPGHGKITNDYNGQVSISWQADLWGELRDQTAFASEQAKASGLDYQFARFSLAASVARAWFTAIAARQQLAIDEDLLKLNQRTARVTADKVRVGAGTQLDSEESKGNVALAEDAVQADRQALTAARRAIDVLLGRYPGGKVKLASKLPPLPGPVPTGLPSQLLERRPDVVAADHRVAAAFHQEASAQAAQLPSVNLNGAIGAVFDPTSLLWSIGGSLLQPLYAGGAIHGEIELTQAQQREAVANYVSVGIEAFREVESALADERYLKQRQAALQRATVRLGNASRIAEDRYDAGIITILDLTQVRTQYFNARSQLLAVRADRLTQRVNLYLALGGPPLSRAEAAKAQVAATQPVADGATGMAMASTTQPSDASTHEEHHGK